MESFDFDYTPSQVGGSDYGNQHQKDPGADIVKFAGGFRLFTARMIDYFVPWALLTFVHAGLVQDIEPLLLLVNSVWLQGTTGQSVGKRAMGIRLIYIPRFNDPTWAFLYPGVGRCFMRMLAHVLDVICFIGFIRGLLNPYGQTFSDSLCSTVVVQDDRTELMTPKDYQRALGQRRS